MTINYLEYIYLCIPFFASYAIITNTYLDFCIYLIGFFFCIDYLCYFINSITFHKIIIYLRINIPVKLLHYIKNYKFRIDMALHHMFSFMIIYFFYNHLYPITYNMEDKNKLIKNVLYTEVSTIFLKLNNLIKNSILKKINQYCFIITFLYYRIYNYSITMIIDINVYLFIKNISKHYLYIYCIFIGIYGLFLLNIYWSLLIFQKCIKSSDET